MIIIVIVDLLDARLHQVLGAVVAREVGHEDFRAIGGNPIFGAGNQAVHFRVDGPDAVTVDQLVTHVIAVGLTGHGAVIARAQDPLVLDQD